MRTEVLIPILILMGSALVSIVALMITSSNKKKRKEELTTNTSPLPVQNNETGFDVVHIDTNEPITPVVEETQTPEVIEPKVIKIDTSNTVVPIKTTPTVVPTNVDNTVLDPTPLPVVDNTVVDTTPLPQVSETVVNPTPLPSVQQTVVDSTPLPLVDVPIPTIDDTPIDVEETKVLTNENEESVEIDTPTPIKEESIPQGEEVNVEESKPLTNESETPVNVDHSKPLANDTGENVDLDFAKPINDMGSMAFASIPTSNTSINTDIKIETNEYDGNKTEIFDISDIKEALNEE